MERRKFIKKSLLTAITASLGTAFYSWKIEPNWTEFVNIKMPILNLPESLIGKTLVQISDMHIGNRFDWNYIIDTFKTTQNLQPDYVVYTGDFVTYENEKQLEQLKTVMAHGVKGVLGTIGVLGNHDYGKDSLESDVANSITKILKNSGVDVLRNNQKSYHGLNFIGIDDFWSTNFYPERVLNLINKKTPNIVLCHNPDVCDLDIWNNYQGWILSGHTHGGQIKPPFLPAPILPVKNKRYSAGLIPLDNNRILYINRALGTLWPIRLNVRPEITIFELQQA